MRVSIKSVTWRGSAVWKWSGGETASAFKGERKPKAEQRADEGERRRGHEDDGGPHGGGR